MIAPLDNFALEFDSITPPARTPGQPSPFDDPFAYGGVVAAGTDPLGALTAWEKNAPPPPEPAPPPHPDAPGFYLIDDCGGRFAIDREFGVITLADETLLERKAGAILSARMRVIEPSGERYEQTVRLKLTGRVPQLADAADEAALGASKGPSGQAESPALVAWTRYAAFAAPARAPIEAPDAPFGAALARPSPEAAPAGAAALLLDAAPPAPASATAWGARAA